MFSEAWDKGSPYGSENSGNLTLNNYTDNTQKQLLLPDPVLRDCSTRETSLEYIILNSPPTKTRDLSKIKTTIISIKNFPSTIEG
jgi:hypothetical protein